MKILKKKVNIMSKLTLDENAETSLEIAERLLEQEHIINMKRIELLSRMIVKLADRFKKLQETLEPELSKLIKLEKSIKELESTTINVLSK